MTEDDGVRTVAEIVKNVKIAMLTTVGADGRLVSRPMGVQDVDFDGDLWFFADEGSHKVHEIEHGSPANASFCGDTAWVSVSGRAEVLRDPEKARELWGQTAQAYYPDGPETPGLVIIRVAGETAEYWASPGGRVATMFRLVKARIVGERPEEGENATVEL